MEGHMTKNQAECLRYLVHPVPDPDNLPRHVKDCPGRAVPPQYCRGIMTGIKTDLNDLLAGLGQGDADIGCGG
jgi:hypothetical protein